MAHPIHAISAFVLPALLAATGAAQTLPGPPTQYPAGNTPNVVAMGDLNHDGLPDLVASNEVPDTITVLLNAGAGTLGAPTSLGVGLTPYGVAIGELNGDGNLDVVSANKDGHSVSVLLGTGTGLLSVPTDYAVVAGAQPQCVAIGDLNGDGKADLVTANGIEGNDTVLLNAGLGTFPLATTNGVTGGYAISDAVALGDLNNDGVLDLVTSTDFPYVLPPIPLGDVYVQLGTGLGTFGAPTIVANGIFAAIGDMNEDGNRDIVTAFFAYSSKLSVVLGNGTGAFLAPTYAGTGFEYPRRVSLADMNGDGHLDAVVGNFGVFGAIGNTITFLFGSGTGAFTTEVKLVVDLEPYCVAIGDLDLNGRVDIATSLMGLNKVAVALSPTPSLPGVVPYGTGTWGCAGALGLSANSAPSVGNSTFAIIGSNAPYNSLGLFLLTDLPDLAGSDPFGLGILFHVGLFGATTTLGLNAYSGPSGEGIIPIPIPNNAAVAGLKFYGQTLWVEPVSQRCTSGLLGLESSRGIALTLQP